MIAWKAQWGFIRNYDVGVREFDALDNTFFSIPTQLDLPVDGSNRLAHTNQINYSNATSSLAEFANLMESSMGQKNYLTITPLFSQGLSDGYRIPFPSFNSFLPNTWEEYYSTGKYKGVIGCHIPSLKRIITAGSGTPFSLIIFDESFKQLFSLQAAPFTIFCQNWTNILAYLGGDTSQSSLLNGNNYKFLDGFVRDNGNYSVYDYNDYSYLNRLLSALFAEYSPPDYNTPTNPYEPGGDSGEGGGDGTFDDASDLIDIPSLPTLSSANTGFTRIYNPTLSQVQNLANYLWTDDSVIETIWNHIKQFFENPMDAIIGFNLVPVPVPNGGTENFKLMYIDTGVSMTVAANQFVDVDCGTLSIEQYYGSALDYSPYTKISCFLPFIGNVSLNVDEVMGRTLQVKYRVDICSGSCVAYILVDGNAIYQYSGHCAIPIPLASADFSSYVNAAISVAKLAGAALTAGAGVAAASLADDAAQQTNQVVTTTQITNTVRNPATGRQITAGTQTRVETREAPKDQSSTQASFSGITPQNVSKTVGQVMSAKPHIEHSGSFSGNSGYLGVRRPFIIIERPNMCMPKNYQTLNGFPSMITLELASCTGFTRVQQVQLTGMGYATNPEQAEILQLLKSGVIL